MNQLDGCGIEDIEHGMSARFAKTITEADIVLFAGASGDNNAVHINEEFARRTAFKGRIADGMLVQRSSHSTLDRVRVCAADSNRLNP